VLGPKSEEEKKKIRIKKEIDTETKSEKSWVSETLGWQKKNKKIQKIDFFDPPTISLQSSKFIETDDGYICRTTTKTCSLNLTLSGIERWISYTWEYDDGDIITSKNPRSKNLSIGSHNITVVASYSWSTDILWTDAIVATVERSIIAKKPKKIKTPKTDTKKESQWVPIIVMEPDKILEDDIPYTTIALVGGILPLVLLRRFFTGMV
jgi:hypothetical protein